MASNALSTAASTSRTWATSLSSIVSGVADRSERTAVGQLTEHPGERLAADRIDAASEPGGLQLTDDVRSQLQDLEPEGPLVARLGVPQRLDEGEGFGCIHIPMSAVPLAGEATVVEGFKELPRALIQLFEGKNIGKMMVKTD